MTTEELLGSTEHMKPFRFKASHRVHEEYGKSQSSSRKRRHRHDASRQRRKRHKSSHLADDPATRSPSYNGLGPNRAFQESLFDALGDDEGAQFWEGVYGQPVHQYPKSYVDEQTGELEQMDDEEYAQYVRRRMWEKSREGIEASREERRREKAQRRQQQTPGHSSKSQQTDSEGPYNNFAFDFEIEAGLRRGQRRRDQRRWQQIWKDYLRRWEELQALAKDGGGKQTENIHLQDQIVWPVESGNRKDISPDEIRRFFKSAADNTKHDDKTTHEALLAILKLERVRWHPDKIQQRYGFMTTDTSTMQGVTSTFQTLDQMWNDLRREG